MYMTVFIYDVRTPPVGLFYDLRRETPHHDPICLKMVDIQSSFSYKVELLDGRQHHNSTNIGKMANNYNGECFGHFFSLNI